MSGFIKEFYYGNIEPQEFSPELAAKLKSKLNALVENEKALFVGDHPVNDIQGALGADMKAVRMNYGDFKGKGLSNNGVSAVIEEITQLLDLI